ncbi:MAG: class I SAM-dependent methyltransferase [candidate division WOR-3 bacterium]|nr:MAG: class I SAM-dependent methyltransferase [candidate division WOR-3 bacterium]
MQQADQVVTGNVFDKKATRHPLERRVVAAFDRRLAELVRGLAPRRVVEIGCGEGNVVSLVKAALPGCFYAAADIDNELLEKSAAKGADRTVLIDLEKPLRLPFPDRDFDLVLLVEVLEHVPSPESTLAEAARLAGSAIASVPFEPWWRLLNMLRFRYLVSLGNTPGHINHWGRVGLHRLVARWFRVERVETSFPWLIAVAGPLAVPDTRHD